MSSVAPGIERLSRRVRHFLQRALARRGLLLLTRAKRIGGAELKVGLDRAPRSRGEVEPIDKKAGHLPGPLNRPYSDNLDASGRFKSAAHLRGEFYALIGAFQPWQVVHMCGSGVTACHNLLAMEAAGMQGSRVFAQSWSGWIRKTER